MVRNKAFAEDLSRDLKVPDFARAYAIESMRIATIDSVVNQLNDAREEAGLTKAELARVISTDPATIRRLFSSHNVNPTLGTLAEVAAALGMRVTLEALSDSELRKITGPLRKGGNAGLTRPA